MTVRSDYGQESDTNSIKTVGGDGVVDKTHAFGVRDLGSIPPL